MTKKYIDVKYKKPGVKPYYTDEVLTKLANSLLAWVRDNHKNKRFAMLGDWCFDNSFHPNNFRRYADKHEKFKEAYEFAKAWQEHVVSKGALNQKLNARFAQFFLGCHYNWHTSDPAQDKLNNARTDLRAFLDYMKERPEEKEKEDEDDDC